MPASKKKNARRTVEAPVEDTKPIPTFGRRFVATGVGAMEEEALEEDGTFRDNARGTARGVTTDAEADADADAAAATAPPSHPNDPTTPTDTNEQPPPKKRAKTSCGSTTAASVLENFFTLKLTRLVGTKSSRPSPDDAKDALAELVAFALGLLQSKLVSDEVYKEVVAKYDAALEAATERMEKCEARSNALADQLVQCRTQGYTRDEARAFFQSVDGDAVRRAVSELEATKKNDGDGVPGTRQARQGKLLKMAREAVDSMEEAVAISDSEG